MRIIEPRQLEEQKAKRQRSKKPLVMVLVLVILSLFGWFGWSKVSANLKPTAVTQTKRTSQTESPKPVAPKQLKIFTGEQFKALYNNFAYPNVVEVTSPPIISGNVEADKRMQTLAEARGYKLRSGPATSLTKVDGFPLQQKAQQPWLGMKAAAKKDGINLGIVSAFRSVDEQRTIFMQRLKATGTTISEVASGDADGAVESVLKTSSLPGYSRHHTGYTFDLMCNGEDFNFFANTPCFKWLSDNNYENAKKYGWIPSYPPGTGIQGPDPEAWEYVWVGTDPLYE